MLAKNLSTLRCVRFRALSLTTIASRLAPTEDRGDREIADTKKPTGHPWRSGLADQALSYSAMSAAAFSFGALAFSASTAGATAWPIAGGGVSSSTLAV